MNQIWEWLKGKKTYLIAALVPIGVFFQSMGWISANTWHKIFTLLVGLGLVTLRSSIADVSDKTPDTTQV